MGGEGRSGYGAELAGRRELLHAPIQPDTRQPKEHRQSWNISVFISIEDPDIKVDHGYKHKSPCELVCPSFPHSVTFSPTVIQLPIPPL